MHENQKVEKRYDPQQAINYLNTLGNPVVEVRIFRKDPYLNGQYTGKIVAGYSTTSILRNYPKTSETTHSIPTQKRSIQRSSNSIQTRFFVSRTV